MRRVTQAACGLFVVAVASAMDPPTAAGIERFQLAEAQRVLADFDPDHPDPDSIIRTLEQRSRDVATVSILSQGLAVARSAAIAGRLGREAKWTRLGVDLADTLYRRYVNSTGTFIERDRAAWIEPARGWRTIPWGVNFRGNEILDSYLLLKGDLSAEQDTWWRAQLGKLGVWIHRNPIVGALVFNAAIDICRLHWRLGNELGRPEWREWALEAAHSRIGKDVDAEGWIQGENGGVSGLYQIVGARHLAEFSVAARDPVLEDAVRRIFRGAIAFAAPSLDWTGNFGTRSSGLMRVPPALILEAARLGDPAAAHIASQSGELRWSADPGLWKEALSRPGSPPAYEPVRRFEGIDATVLREGPWVVYLSNYRRSLWARGFIGLWHAGHGDWVFSSLHSLPSQVEKAKQKLGDTSDWSGLPHIRIHRDKSVYDSQQKMESLEVSRDKAVLATWSEPLLDREGRAGGMAAFRLRMAGDDLDISVKGSDLAGRATVDYHVMHRPTSSIALWAGEEVERILSGRLPETGGGYQDRAFHGPAPGRYAIQIDNSVMGFEVLECPKNARIALGVLTDNGLHTGNHGGFRLRFELPQDQSDFTIALRMRRLN